MAKGSSKNNPKNRKKAEVDNNVKAKYKTMSFWTPKSQRGAGKR